MISWSRVLACYGVSVSTRTRSLGNKIFNKWHPRDNKSILKIIFYPRPLPGPRLEPTLKRGRGPLSTWAPSCAEVSERKEVEFPSEEVVAEQAAARHGKGNECKGGRIEGQFTLDLSISQISRIGSGCCRGGLRGNLSY
eukprot:588816-Pelagomonas_calceolata.AAC.1